MRVLILTVLFLAACSGGGGDLVIDPIDGLPKTITPEPDPTPTGTASYRGPATLGFVPVLSDAVELNGTLALLVNFDGGAEAITGDATGFETSLGGAVEGRLFLSGGALDDTNTALLFSSRISGSLRSGIDSYLIFGTLAGEFQETNQSAVTGRVTRTVRQSGNDAPLTGSFQAARLP
jgi:hypothetical protein